MNIETLIAARRNITGRVALKTYEGLRKLRVSPLAAAFLSGAASGAANALPRLAIVAAAGVVGGKKAALFTNLTFLGAEALLVQAYGLDAVAPTDAWDAIGRTAEVQATAERVARTAFA